jgi:hypothetical protein
MRAILNYQDALDIDFDIDIDDETVAFEYAGKGYYFNLIVDEQIRISYGVDVCRYNGEITTMSEDVVKVVEIYDLIECWQYSNNDYCDSDFTCEDIEILNEAINKQLNK